MFKISSIQALADIIGVTPQELYSLAGAFYENVTFGPVKIKGNRFARKLNGIGSR